MSGASGPGGALRAGRRERARAPHGERPFLERYRTPLVAGVVAVLLVGLVGFVFASANAASYSCSTLLEPQPTGTPLPNGSPAPLGQVENDQGTDHIAIGETQRYSTCPPASGPHYNEPGGPIDPGYYGPDNRQAPQGWIHNLEHGALVVLYRCPGGTCPSDVEATLRSFYERFPNSPVCDLPAGRVGPVIARFEDMSTPYAALVWGRVLLLGDLDTQRILDFWNEWGERTNPEPQCAHPSPSASPSASPGPTPSAS